MWYIPDVGSIEDMSEAEKKVFEKIFNNEPFFIGLKSNMKGIKVIELIVVDGDVKIYFANPSAKRKIFSSLKKY